MKLKTMKVSSTMPNDRKSKARILGNRRTAHINWPPAAFAEGESLWIILLKVCAFNYARSAKVLEHFGVAAVNGAGPRKGRTIVPDLRYPSKLDLDALACAADISVAELVNATLESLFRDRSATARWLSWKNLRFCAKCLASGFHSLLFQLRGVDRCPLHDVAIIDACPSCGSMLPLVLPSRPTRLITCPSCQAELGCLPAENGDAFANTAAAQALCCVRDIFAQRTKEIEWLFRQEFVRSSLADLDQLHAPTPHNRNLLRYICESFDQLVAPELRASMTEPINHTTVWREITDATPVDRSSGAAGEPDRLFHEAAANLYQRLVRHWRRRIRRRKRLTALAATDETDLTSGEWTYLVLRAWFEVCSLACVPFGPPSTRSHVDQAFDVGSHLSAIAGSCVRFIPFGVTRLNDSDVVWANLHAFAVCFSTLRSSVLGWVEQGTPIETVLERLQSKDPDFIPMMMLRTRSSQGTVAVHWWHGQRDHHPT